jgi:pimeloyl-ACP methyl ester carboxylesterase
LTPARRPSYEARAVPPPFTSKYIDIDGTALHYLHTTPTSLPDAPPPLDRGRLFLLVHGGGRNAGDWRRQLVGLGTGHSVVAPDLPGHGRSGGIEGLPTVEAYADVLDRLVAALPLRPSVLVGWSMGLGVALVSAVRHPERYRGLVLLSGVPGRPEPAALDRVRDVVRGRLPQQFDTMLFSPATPMEVMREAWMEQVKTDPRVLHGDLLAAAAFDDGALLARVRLPTLVVHGADDRLVTGERAQALARGIPGARLEVVADAGHVVQLEQAERVNALLAAFADGAA